MALSKRTINLGFAFLVFSLALIAGTAAFKKLERPVNSPAETQNAQTGVVTRDLAPMQMAQQLAALEQMAAKDPNNAEHQARVANLYYDMGQYEKALDFYERSLKLKPNDPYVETDLAICFHYLGRHDEALRILDKVLGYSPGFPQAMFNKGVILANAKKDLRGAIAVWEDLLRVNPDYPQRAEVEERIRQLRASIQPTQM